jgi:hypothetical protein
MIRFIKFLVPFAIIFGLIQNYCFNVLMQPCVFLYKTTTIYIYNSVIAILLFSFLIYVNKKDALKTGFAFMGANLIKMFLVLIFLIPLIQSDIIADKSLDMLAVIIPYFLFLIFETVFSIDLINKK